MKRTTLIGILVVVLLLGCWMQQGNALEEPTAAPEATPAPVDTPVPADTAAPTDTPTPSSFSLAWVPDTQVFANSHPEAFPLLARQINERRERENILGVVHSGDLVDNGFKDWQWDNFELFLQELDPDLFFFPVSGNHDVGTKRKSHTAYVKRDFLNAYPASQKYSGGRALYRVLSAGDRDILLLGVGWEMWKSRDAVKWVDQVLSDHAGMPCLLVIHGFLLSETGYYSSVEQFIAKRPAIRLVLCGHMRDYYTHVFTYDDDKDGQQERVVTALMLNMQEQQDQADFAFRILTIDPLANTVAVNTYLLDGSPAQDLPKLGPISFVLEDVF